MSQTTNDLAKCPKCGQTVPDWAQLCQFCGTLMPNRPKVTRAVVGRGSAVASRSWQNIAYMVVSCWWLLQGVRIILASAPVLPSTMAGIGPMFVGIVVLGMVVGAFLLLVGIGLLLKNETARGIVNILCWIQIVGGLFSLASGILSSLFLGPIGLIGALMSLIDVLTAGFMVYLIGETDQYVG